MHRVVNALPPDLYHGIETECLQCVMELQNLLFKLKILKINISGKCEKCEIHSRLHENHNCFMNTNKIICNKPVFSCFQF